ncbi:MAG: hypothetical protein ACLQO1_02615 [Steroidobacteraceae bacterium]
MSKKLPRSLPRNDFLDDLLIHEAIVFPDQKNTLSRWFKKHLAHAWDVEALTDEEASTVIKYLRRNKRKIAAVIFEFKTTKKQS